MTSHLHSVLPHLRRAVLAEAILFVMVLVHPLWGATYYSRNGGGNWNTAATWSTTSHAGSAAAVPPASSDAVVIGDNDVVTLDIGVTNNSSITVDSTGTLYLGINTINGTGTFTLNSGGALGIGQSAGITSSGASGNIRVSGTRTFSTAADYLYNVDQPTQSTGSGLPATVNNLTINNSNGVTLTSSVAVNGTLTLANGTLSVGSNTLVINNTLSVSSGTLSSGSAGTIDYAQSSGSHNVLGITYGILRISNGATRILSGNASIQGKLKVNGGIFDLSSYTANRASAGDTITVSNGATLRIGGTNGFPSNYTTRLIWGGSTIEYYGANQAVTALPYGHLTLSGSGTKTMPGSNMTLSGNFTMSGTPSATAGQALLVWGNFTIGSGCTFSAGSYTHTLKADFSNNGTFTSATSTIIFNGNANQNITGSTSVFNNVTILNAAGVTLAANITLNGTLTLTSGNVATGSWFVSIVSTGTVSRTSGHIVGNLRKIIPTGAASKTFEIGTGADYTPVSVTFGNVTATGNLAATTTTGDHANIASATIDPAKSVNRTWTLTNGGITFDNYSATFTFVSGDVDAGASPSNFIVGTYSGSWTYPTVGTKTATTTQITGLTSFSDFQIGELGGLPVQLSSFMARAAAGAPGVTLEWMTVSETNNYGFEVERKGTAQSEFATLPNSFVPGYGTTLIAQHYSFIDASAGPGQWLYRLKQIDLDGAVEFSEPISVTVEAVTGVNDLKLSAEFALQQNYPNPFNPTTVVSYQLPVASHVRLVLFDIVGREVMTLVDERQQAGVKQVILNASGLPSGAYLYRLSAGDFQTAKRLVLLK